METHVNTDDNIPEIVDQAKECPSCGYTAEASGFEICPKCGLIIGKYNNRIRLGVVESVSELLPCKKCGCTGTSPAAPFCAICGEPVGNENDHYPVVKGAVVLIILVLLLLVFYQFKPRSESSGPPAGETSQKSEAPNPAYAGGSSAPAASSPSTETQPATQSTPPAELPGAMPNSLGITKALVVFAPTDNGGKMPLSDLRRISIDERRIYAHVRIVIPAEKSFQFNGRLYDGEGKLVMNVPSPIKPKVANWYVWYYHDIDKGVDKAGTWKFALLVNGEQVAERQIEVTE